MVARFCCQGRHYRKLERNRPWRNHEGKHGTLFLNLANDFTGTVAGMAGHDGIDWRISRFRLIHPLLVSLGPGLRVVLPT